VLTPGPGAPLGLFGLSTPAAVRELSSLAFELAALGGGTAASSSLVRVSRTVGPVLRSAGAPAMLGGAWELAGKLAPTAATVAAIAKMVFIATPQRVVVVALVLAPPVVLLLVETLAPPLPTPTPVVEPTPTPTPVVVPVLAPAPGVLVVPATPVPMAELPPTLPPVVTPVDWARAADPAKASTAARAMVLVMVIPLR